MQVAVRGAVVDNLPSQTRLGKHDRVAVRLCNAQIGAPQDGGDQIRAAQIRVGHHSETQICAAEVGVPEIRVVQIRIEQIRAEQIATGEVASSQVFSDQVGVRQLNDGFKTIEPQLAPRNAINEGKRLVRAADAA